MGFREYLCTASTELGRLLDTCTLGGGFLGDVQLSELGSGAARASQDL